MIVKSGFYFWIINHNKKRKVMNIDGKVTDLMVVRVQSIIYKKSTDLFTYLFWFRDFRLFVTKEVSIVYPLTHEKG